MDYSERVRFNQKLKEYAEFRQHFSTPWWRQAIAELVASDVAEVHPQIFEANFNVLIACGVEEAIDRLVASSESNTKTMSRLTRAYVWLTCGLFLVAAVQVWLAYWRPPQPVQVNVPVPTVQVQLPAPPAALPAAPVVGRPGNRRPASSLP